MEILLGAKEENIMNGATSKTDLSVHTLKKLYDRIVYPRLIEEKMLNLLRQGKISKWFSGSYCRYDFSSWATIVLCCWCSHGTQDEE